MYIYFLSDDERWLTTLRGSSPTIFDQASSSMDL